MQLVLLAFNFYDKDPRRYFRFFVFVERFVVFFFTGLERVLLLLDLLHLEHAISVSLYGSDSIALIFPQLIHALF
jgi:hypothetical protein